MVMISISCAKQTSSPEIDLDTIFEFTERPVTQKIRSPTETMMPGNRLFEKRVMGLTKNCLQYFIFLFGGERRDGEKILNYLCESGGFIFAFCFVFFSFFPFTFQLGFVPNKVRFKFSL